ncbi:MAG: response regulator transcription factor [Xenococcaceae cyanobacterium]
MIKIILVEDQEIIRRGLKTLLETNEDLQVVGEANNGKVAIDLVDRLHQKSLPPDVVLMDIRMPVMDGVEATKAICQKYPQTKILVLTTFDDTKYVAKALSFGAKGYLLKDTPTEELAQAIHSIHQGYTQFGPGIVERAIAEKLANEVDESKQPPPGLSELTPREKEVLKMIATGASNREIAKELFLSEGTVRNHISNILGRLNVRDRTQAAIVANTFPEILET